MVVLAPVGDANIIEEAERHRGHSDRSGPVQPDLKGSETHLLSKKRLGAQREEHTSNEFVLRADPDTEG